MTGRLAPAIFGHVYGDGVAFRDLTAMTVYGGGVWCLTSIFQDAGDVAAVWRPQPLTVAA